MTRVWESPQAPSASAANAMSATSVSFRARRSRRAGDRSPRKGGRTADDERRAMRDGRADMRGGSLPTGDCDAPAPPLPAHDDRPQAAHGLHVLALDPAPRAERLQQTIRECARLGLQGEAHACGSGGVASELVDPERAHAVVLAAAPDLDDAMRMLDLHEGHV